MEKSVLTPIEQFIVDYVLKLRTEHNLTQKGYWIYNRRKTGIYCEYRKPEK